MKLVDLQMQLRKAGRGNLTRPQLVQSQATVMLHLQNNFEQHRILSPLQCSLRELHLCSLARLVLSDGHALFCSGFLAHMSRVGSGDVTDSFADKQRASL